MKKPGDTITSGIGSNYRTNWNHILIQLTNIENYDGQCPLWWTTAQTTDIPEEDVKKYKWISDISELPNPSDTVMIDDETYAWTVIQDKQKPGVESFDYPIYEIIESGEYSSERKASWVIQKAAGKIFTKPELGNFGITGGNWLCEGGSVNFNGAKWVATRTWTHSPQGWDTDLYGPVNNN